MEKQLLLKNILVELSQLPEAYLQHWYELIHTFREKLPVQEDNADPKQDTDFDWDAFVDEAMKHRSQGNRSRAKRGGTVATTTSSSLQLPCSTN